MPKTVEINIYSKAFKDQQANLFSEYLNVGGFPEAILFAKSFSRQAFFQNIANDIVFRDIVLRHDISKPEILKTMVLLLFSMMGCLLSESKLYQRLSGMQVRISKPTMSEYFEYILESYCFFSIPILGQKLENIVFLHLRRQTDKVFYYKTQSGYEVDFAAGPDSSLQLVQVCADLSNSETLEREKRSLLEAMKELNQKSSIIVTLDEEKTIECDNKTIKIVPAWKYLLENSAGASLN